MASRMERGEGTAFETSGQIAQAGKSRLLRGNVGLPPQDDILQEWEGCLAAESTCCWEEAGDTISDCSRSHKNCSAVDGIAAWQATEQEWDGGRDSCRQWQAVESCHTGHSTACPAIHAEVIRGRN